MKKIIPLLFLLWTPCFGQGPERPRLVVGIVVDQMRYDFLYRFSDKFGKDGFRRLMNEGYSCRNARYNYVPTYTGPGHASIYTGATPSVHGIIANEWFDRRKNDTVYCVSDKNVMLVGEGNAWAGMMSPRNLLSTSVTDELRLATNSRARVIGIGMKDRGAILPAGHTANAAYWFDSKNGGWITSSYYMKELPEWVKKFNGLKHADNYLGQTWSTLFPIEQYVQSTADDMPFEGSFFQKGKHTFPYDLSALRTAGFEVLRSTPFGNTFTKDFAKEAILAEKLGKGEATDFLTLSFSSTDYIGHLFGPNSVEIEDTYARLDRDIADFLKFLDDYLGKDKVLVFLTSDHGVAHVPDFLKQNRIPGGVIDSGMLLDSLSRYLKGVFGHQVISCYINQQIYINYPLLDEKQISSKEVQERIAAFLLRFKGVSGTITSFSLMNNEFGKGINSLINNGFYLKRSGDIIVTLEPGWFEGKRSGSTHGQAYSYDTHVPLLWYGWKVRKGSDVKPRNITDIAPTLAEMLRIESPSGCSGVPISELMPD